MRAWPRRWGSISMQLRDVDPTSEVVDYCVILIRLGWLKRFELSKSDETGETLLMIEPEPDWETAPGDVRRFIQEWRDR